MKNEAFTPPPNPWLRWQWQYDRDELVVLPAGLYVWGLIRWNAEILGWAIGLWVLGFVIWSLWTTWKVADRYPKEDAWRAVAILVYAGGAWLLAVPTSLLPAALGLAIAFPVVFVLTMAAIVAARRKGLAPLPHGRRVWLLGGAAGVCGLWAVLAGTLLVRDAQDFRWVALPIIAFNIVLGLLLVRHAIKGFTPPLAMTTEAILARNP